MSKWAMSEWANSQPCCSCNLSAESANIIFILNPIVTNTVHCAESDSAQASLCLERLLYSVHPSYIVYSTFIVLQKSCATATLKQHHLVVLKCSAWQQNIISRCGWWSALTLSSSSLPVSEQKKVPKLKHSNIILKRSNIVYRGGGDDQIVDNYMVRTR